MKKQREKTCWFVLWGVMLLMLLALACQINPQKRLAEFVTRGDKYLAAGETQNAIIEYRRALRIDAHSAEVEYKLGQAYFANHQSREAFLAYRKAVESNADYAPARVALGRFSLLSRNFDEAMTTAQSILQKDPGNMEAQILLADAYAGKKNLPEGTKGTGETRPAACRLCAWLHQPGLVLSGPRQAGRRPRAV